MNMIARVQRYHNTSMLVFVVGEECIYLAGSLEFVDPKKIYKFNSGEEQCFVDVFEEIDIDIICQMPKYFQQKFLQEYLILEEMELLKCVKKIRDLEEFLKNKRTK